ncbi:aspartyl-phosphate phosphatase Spo0E family protein [Clostridium bowmanii]|uniref:aspartyl-phosphate phosphatase Spo0E family protein n=1 Tax=Clostridium bowmanii TaxID=132925 RepID=UPI001C0BEF6C|nr:aspartyl-phosphate phosphatase Spo0E family protein [Clostridium bowmanii]MBU3191545.1 aspartyl-phosphate phosphatase Spo0E family protein [Clostridium bowmanii]MCA1075851.1 aspartyl-phosphate phosphatase Spo0E family protein [Clostridium bowmanii]
MNNDIELVRDKLEKLIIVTQGVTDCKVVSLSQELDKLITNYYLQNAQDGVSVSMEKNGNEKY